MTSIFISYSRRDKTVAEYVAHELSRRGAEVFIDYEELMPGEDFVERIGREIESRDVVVFIVSNNAANSKWVKAEIAWAFYRDKPIIPLSLENISLTSFFFLINIEMLDFTRWYIDGDVRSAMLKLTNALSLSQPTETIEEISPARVLAQQSNESDYLMATDIPINFALSDLQEMFQTATEIADQDPERAVFLYEQVLEADPTYLNGKARDFVIRETNRIQPKRINRLLDVARQAIALGDWTKAGQLANDVLNIDKRNTDAKKLLEGCEQNSECEPIYEMAEYAIEQGKHQAALRYLRDVCKQCPQYGDPRRLRLSAGLSPFLKILPRSVSDLNKVISRWLPQFSAIKAISFSVDGTLLFTGQADGTVRVWDRNSLIQILELNGHQSGILSIAHSPIQSLIATSSGDKTIRLWNLQSRKEVGLLEGHKDKVDRIVFSKDGVYLCSCSADSRIAVWNVIDKNIIFETKGDGSNSLLYVESSNKVLFIADGESDKKNIHALDISRKTTTKIITHQNIEKIALSSSGRFLAFLDGKEIRLWNKDEKIFAGVITRQRSYDALVDMMFSPDEFLFAYSSGDSVYIADVGLRENLKTIRNDHNITALAFSPDGTMLATGNERGELSLWGTA